MLPKSLEIYIKNTQISFVLYYLEIYINKITNNKQANKQTKKKRNSLNTCCFSGILKYKSQN